MASDRAALLKAFEESRTGVRGLVESGVSSVPELFVHPDPYASAPLAPPGVSIPVVDLSLPTPAAVAAAAEAARRWGFFHLVNHHQALAGVPDDYPARALAAVRAFNELPAADRAAHYGRAGGVSYYSNLDLFRSPVTSWRDSIKVELDGQPVRMPHACLADVPEWDAHATTVARAVLRLLSEGLGLVPPALEETTSLEGKVMICHYYPACPEPERTMGIVVHTDPGVLTVLAQDAVGGLQVKHTDEQGRTQWVDVKPVPGALVINVGDLLQIMSNDKYTSVEHRVIMNTCKEARVSIATFFTPAKNRDSVFHGPLPELVSSENPPKYRTFTMSDFLGTFYKQDLASKALIDHFKFKKKKKLQRQHGWGVGTRTHHTLQIVPPHPHATHPLEHKKPLPPPHNRSPLLQYSFPSHLKKKKKSIVSPLCRHLLRIIHRSLPRDRHSFLSLDSNFPGASVDNNFLTTPSRHRSPPLPWLRNLQTPGSTTTRARRRRPWRTCTAASSRRCSATSPSSTGTRTASSTPPRRTKGSGRSGPASRSPPQGLPSSTASLDPRRFRRMRRSQLSSSPFTSRTSTRASTEAIQACMTPMEGLFLKSLRRYSRSMPKPGLMPSQPTSCRSCSRRIGSLKISRDGWGASRSGRCCTPSAKTRMGFFTRKRSGLSTMAACLIGWSKRGKPRRSLLRRNDRNIRIPAAWKNCKLRCACAGLYHTVS